VMELKGKMILISRKREEFLFVYRETSLEDFSRNKEYNGETSIDTGVGDNLLFVIMYKGIRLVCRSML